jgi:membrane protease YdiL (CAAX protease family)
MIEEKPWRIETVACLFAGIMAALCFAQLFGIVLDSEKLKMSAEDRELAKMALGSIFLNGTILICIGLFLRENRISWSAAFGLEKARQPRAVAVGILAAVLFVPLEMAWMYSAQLVLEHPVAQPLVQALQRTDLRLAEKALMGVLAVFIAPLAEEMIFRGVLYPTIKQAGYPATALWVTSLIFGAVHANLIAFVPLTVFSLLLIWVYERTGSLWASITAHSLFNFTSFAVLMFPASLAPAAPLR